MIYDLAPAFTPLALIAPEAQPVKKRRRSKARRYAPALAVGMIIVLDDSSRCQIVGFAANGHPLCVPLSP